MTDDSTNSATAFIKVTSGGTSVFVMPGEELIIGRDPKHRLIVDEATSDDNSGRIAAVCLTD